MVGGYGVDQSGGHGLTERVAVGRTFDGGIALYAGAEHGVLLVGKGEILRAGFGCDQFSFGAARLEQFELAGRGYM